MNSSIPVKRAVTSLNLTAIFYRPDVNQWTVWINNNKIDSRQPRSIDGWRVIHVTADSVRVRSLQGQEQELFLEIYDDLDQNEIKEEPVENVPPVKEPSEQKICPKDL